MERGGGPCRQRVEEDDVRRYRWGGPCHDSNWISSPTSVPVLPMVPAGSSRTPRALQKTLDMRFLRNRSYRPTTFRSGPRKSASNSKRIPSEWMLLHGEIQSPSPAVSPFLHNSPRDLDRKVRASRIEFPTVTFRVTLRALIGERAHNPVHSFCPPRPSVGISRRGTDRAQRGYPPPNVSSGSS